MIKVFLVNYKVQGIKNLDSMVSLSFYRKKIHKNIDTQKYNIKGIYGMNGSGKSAIIMSVDILRNLLVDEDYLNDLMVQNNLTNIINNKTGEIYIGVEFLVKDPRWKYLCKYEVVLNRNISGKIVIDREEFAYKNRTSKEDEFKPLLKVQKGEILKDDKHEKSEFEKIFEERTKNLLSKSTAAALFISKIINSDDYSKIAEKNESLLFYGILALLLFGKRIFVYMEQSDSHIEHIYSSVTRNIDESINSDCSNSDSLSSKYVEYGIDVNQLNMIYFGTNLVSKDDYDDFERTVESLKGFIQIFKPHLTNIDIEKKENGDYYACSLNMVYGTYSINTEFESTGIKKLIKLFAYLQAMVQGGIVFIDEFDSNLHDVYLCALIEYLMEYAKGQLCFTTHNVGPMDILKSHKKSIDFLSIDHKIYSWKKNGNYSPSKLYRNGMIVGSPFNIDSIDFIGIFDVTKEDKE